MIPASSAGGRTSTRLRMRTRTGEARIQGAPTVADARTATRPARERQLDDHHPPHRPGARRHRPRLAVRAAAGAGAAGATAQPELGPLSPAFVEALHDPLVTLGLGPRAEPGGGAGRRGRRGQRPRARRCPPPTTCAPGRLTPVKDQGDYVHLLGVRQHRRARVEAPARADTGAGLQRGQPGPAQRLRPFAGRRYDCGGYDFMAVAYFARWAGPVDEATTRTTRRRRRTANRRRKHVQDVVMLPGRAELLDNDLIKQLVIENGALSVGMYMGPRTRTWTTSHRPSLLRPRTPRARTTASASSAGTTPTPPPLRRPVGSRPGDGAFLVRNSWGAELGRRRLLLGLLLRQVVRPRAGPRRLRRHDVVLRRRGRRQLLRATTSTTSSASPPTGLRQHQRVVGRQQVHGDGRRRPSPPPASTRCPRGRQYQVWAGPIAAAAHAARVRHAALPGYVTVPLTTPLRVTQGRPFVVAVSSYSPGDEHPLAIERPRAQRGCRQRRGRGGPELHQPQRRRRGPTSTERAARAAMSASRPTPQ